MVRFNRSWFGSAWCTALALALGCSGGSSDGAPGAGGTAGTFGQGGLGGSQSQSGGAVSTGGGGGIGQGGATASGGSIVTVRGGTNGQGGHPTVGGTNTLGGANGQGGDPGLGGAPAAGGTIPTSCDDQATLEGTVSDMDVGVTIPVTGSDKTYYLGPNWWDRFDGETEDYQGLSFTIRDSANAAQPATEGNPLGYPSLYIGTYKGQVTGASNLPRRVSDLISIPTEMVTNALSKDTSNFNAAYDVWFTANDTPLASDEFSPRQGGAYLMVWLFDPADRQPRGGQCSPDAGCWGDVTEHSVDGVPGNWDVWIDHTDPLCISYVSTTPRDQLKFDLNDFIKDAVANGYGIQPEMYLSIIFGGFEVWGGGDGLQMQRFCAAVY